MDFTTNKEKIEEKLLKAKATDNVDLNALYEHGIASCRCNKVNATK